MSTIREMRERWQKVSVVSDTKDTLEENAQEVVALEQNQLYQTGLDGNDSLLREYQDPDYAAYKHERNPQPGEGNPDLYYTGAFYDAMYLRLNGDTMEIDSSDPKRDALVLRYGPSILRLDTVSKNGLRKNILQPSLVQKIALQTGCGTG